MSEQQFANSEYSQDGLRFRYPEDWSIEESRDGNDVTVQVQSPETTFWCITILKDCPAPSHAIQTVVDAFNDSYENTDVYDIDREHEVGLFMMTKQIDFVCHDLVSTAKVEAFQNNLATILILAQGYDREMKDYESTLQEMSASVVFE